MRGLKRLATAAVIAAGHDFVQNIRRGHDELAVDIAPAAWFPAAFTELAGRSEPPQPGRTAPEYGERDIAGRVTAQLPPTAPAGVVAAPIAWGPLHTATIHTTNDANIRILTGRPGTRSSGSGSSGSRSGTGTGTGAGAGPGTRTGLDPKAARTAVPARCIPAP
jgi:hypothetical protein